MKSLGAKLRPVILASNNDPDPTQPAKVGCAAARTPATVAGLAKEGSDVGCRFLPLLLVLSVLLWFYTTTGGRQIFVKEVLGGAYDSQAKHFLRGNVDVDVQAIAHEAIIVNGKVRMSLWALPGISSDSIESLAP